MKSKQLCFFAILEDLIPIFKEIEDLVDIRYHIAGFQKCLEISVFSTIFETANLGIATSGDWNKIDRYLILQENESLNIREVIQKDGSVRFAVDQMNNLKSIELKIGGIFLIRKKLL